MTHPLFTNRLIKEKSPYLLQHAHNPVDWYPWSDEAFRQAKELDRPVFLSIGYATCHWCHVMEHESFSNVEVAQLMNETFINIKVDREEKPDVDSLYMEFAQAMMSGGAGWPLNVILTPELLPFFAATYLPMDSARGFIGMKQLILRIRQIWSDPEEKENVIHQAGKIVDVFAEHIKAQGQEFPTKEHIHEAAEILYKSADPIYGGMRGAPKFPIGYQAGFLLRLAKSSSDSRALFYVEKTLEMMHRGGIYDHLGGGFSRYSVDEKWLIPHFEKMLYDNAILARAYLETWELTHQNLYREIAEHIFEYIYRVMTDSKGGFYSAEDADSEGHEGRFYTWTWNEIHSILGVDAPIFCQFFGVTPGGNFEARNVLHMPYSLSEFTRYHHLDPILFSNKVKELKQKLWEVRETRPHPIKDDKIITSWNGLMIYSFAKAGSAFHNETYLNYAENASRFIKEHLWKGESLLRRYRDGEARFEGCLDDYAFYIHGILSLFEADCGSEWLEFAVQLSNILLTDFKAPHGAYFLTNGRDPSIILRRCEFYDGAEPSGNAVHAENLIRLYQITGVESYLKHAEDILKAAKMHIDLYPPGASYHLMTLQWYLDQASPILMIALNEQEQYKEEIKKMLSGRFIPHKSVIWKRESDEVLRDLSPLCREKIPMNGKTTLYLCTRTHCEEPVQDISKMWKVIEKI